MKKAIAVLAVVVWAGSPALTGAQPPAKPPEAAPTKAGPKKLDKPLWRELSPPQQLALQPLQAEWDAMDGVRKRKWLGLANRFASMKPAEQQRVHERMRDWMKLTPAQRNLARENYSRTKKIDPSKKTATWQSYQQLPEDEKKKLAASARKPGAAPATQPAPKSAPQTAAPVPSAPVAPAVPAPNAK